MSAKVTIQTRGRYADILIDGEPIHNVTSYRIEQEAGELALMTLKIRVKEITLDGGIIVIQKPE